MASIKIAKNALISAGISVDHAQEFMNKLNSAFGPDWSSGDAGIVLGPTVLLPKNEFKGFLAYKANMQDVVINITSPTIPSAATTIVADVSVEAADYYELDNGKFQCNHCSHKPYARESSCIKHLESKHADKLEE